MIATIGGLPRPFGVRDFTAGGLRGVSMAQLARHGIRGLGEVDLAAVNSLQKAKNDQFITFAKAVATVMNSKGYNVGLAFAGGEYNGAYLSPVRAEIQVPKLGGSYGFNYYLVSAGWTPEKVANLIISELTSRPEDFPMQLPQAPVTQVAVVPVAQPVVNIVAPSTKVSTQPVAPTQQVVTVKPTVTATGIPVNTIASGTPIQTAAVYDPYVLQQQTEQQQTRIVDDTSVATGPGEQPGALYRTVSDILQGSYFMGIPNWMLGIGAVVAYKMLSAK